MIDQLNMYGMTKLEVSIERIKQIEPRGGSWYLAFSGGKDSCVIKALCDMAGVKYDAHYRISSVDPPELVRFIKEKHPDVSMDFPRYKDGSVITMWNLIPKKTMPPTRMVRYCCQYLKEDGGEGRDTITGVRWDESNRRKKNRAGLEVDTSNRKGWQSDRNKLDPDNMDEDMVRYCMQSKGFILNPIIDWTTDEVWEFIHRYNIPYCELYDQGFKRIGCIGCPMSTHRKEELDRYPKFKQAYLRAFDRMIQHQIEGGVFPRDKVKSYTNFGRPDKRYITDTEKLYSEWVHDRLQSGRYNDLVDTIGGLNEQRYNIRGHTERTRKSHHKSGELEARNTTGKEGIQRTPRRTEERHHQRGIHRDTRVLKERNTMKMAENCALYRCEKHEEDGIKWKDEYCDGLDDPICKCKVICPFYKSKNKWRAVTVRKQTQYVRIE